MKRRDLELTDDDRRLAVELGVEGWLTGDERIRRLGLDGSGYGPQWDPFSVELFGISPAPAMTRTGRTWWWNDDPELELWQVVVRHIASPLAVEWRYEKTSVRDWSWSMRQAVDRSADDNGVRRYVGETRLLGLEARPRERQARLILAGLRLIHEVERRSTADATAAKRHHAAQRDERALHLIEGGMSNAEVIVALGLGGVDPKAALRRMLRRARA